MAIRQAARVKEFPGYQHPHWCYWRSNEGACSWYLNIPGCGLAGLANHQVEEHEDGTITVTPSILTRGHDADGNPVTRHGFLTRGGWTGCADDPEA